MPGRRGRCCAAGAAVTGLPPDRVSGCPPSGSGRYPDGDPGIRDRYRRALRGAAFRVHRLSAGQFLRAAVRRTNAALDSHNRHRSVGERRRAARGCTHALSLERGRALARPIHGNTPGTSRRTGGEGRGAPGVAGTYPTGGAALTSAAFASRLQRQLLDRAFTRTV